MEQTFCAAAVLPIPVRDQTKPRLLTRPWLPPMPAGRNIPILVCSRKDLPMPKLSAVVDALMELMNAKDELSAKVNAKGVVFNAIHQKEVLDLQNKVGAAQTKVATATQMFQAELAKALQRP
jgi:hypothetical protein